MRNLKETFTNYATSGTQQSYEEFIAVFFENIRGNGSVFVPLTSDSQLATVHSQDNGDYYIICTSEEELDLCRPENSKETGLKEVVDATMSNPNVKGICVNPHNPSPCLVSKYYMMAMMV